MLSNNKSSALPESWIIPMKLGIYAVLAGCSAYIFFNVGDLEVTQYLIIISIVVVAAMALLDCRMSEHFWKQNVEKSNDNDNHQE